MIFAAIFLPITATGTILGMNFVNVRSRSEGVWVWILTTIPVMRVSLAAIAWDIDTIRNMERSK